MKILLSMQFRERVCMHRTVILTVGMLFQGVFILMPVQALRRAQMQMSAPTQVDEDPPDPAVHPASPD